MERTDVVSTILSVLYPQEDVERAGLAQGLALLE